MESRQNVVPRSGMELSNEPWPPQWMLNLERAHDQLRHGARLLENGAQPVIDLRPAARLLEGVFGSLYAAYDEREERLVATKNAIAQLDGAIIELRPAASQDAAIGFAIEYLQEARKELGQAEARLAPLVPRPRQPAPDLRASRDVPTLHALDRPVLVPKLKVPEPPPPEPVPESVAELQPKTFEELDAAVEAMKRRVDDRRKAREEKKALEKAKDAAERVARGEDPEPPPGFVRDVPKKMAPLAYLAQRARECFEEVAMIGMQRAPLLGDPWRNTMFLERRMLHALDAVVALGPHALAQLEPWVRDSPAKDPSRVFAIGLVLGCVEGRDAIAAAERVFFSMEVGEPDVVANFAGALKLATHPYVSIVLRTLLADPDPSHRALAIDVLGYRGLATQDELARAAVDAAPEVAAAALPYFALTKNKAIREAIEAALEKDHAPLRVAAWQAMAFSGHPHAASRVANAVTGEQQEAAAFALGLVGDGRDGQFLLEHATATPTRPLITAVGWAGRADAIVPLMSFLEHEDEAVKFAAAYALDRITGAGMYDEMEIEPDEIMVPDVPDPDVGGLGGPKAPSLARQVSDPRDLPGKGSGDSIQRPTIDINRWKAYWQENQQKYDLKARFRRGRRYTPMISHEELDRWPATPGERRMLVRELIIRTGGHVRMDPHDFIVVQEEALKEWAPLAHAASSTPGMWNVPLRK